MAIWWDLEYRKSLQYPDKYIIRYNGMLCVNRHMKHYFNIDYEKIMVDKFNGIIGLIPYSKDKHIYFPTELDAQNAYDYLQSIIIADKLAGSDLTCV
jgi:hypothetical protein